MKGAGAAFALALAACEAPAPRPVAASAAPPPPPCSVELDVRDLAGAGALDCGASVDATDEAASARGRACILGALARGQPFSASVVGPSFDSHYVEGFVGRRVRDRYEALHLTSDAIAGVPVGPAWFADACDPIEDLAARCDAGRAWEKIDHLSRACAAFVDHTGGHPASRVARSYGLWCGAPTPIDACRGGVRAPARAATRP